MAIIECYVAMEAFEGTAKKCYEVRSMRPCGWGKADMTIVNQVPRRRRRNGGRKGSSQVRLGGCVHMLTPSSDDDVGWDVLLKRSHG